VPFRLALVVPVVPVGPAGVEIQPVDPLTAASENLADLVERHALPSGLVNYIEERLQVAGTHSAAWSRASDASHSLVAVAMSWPSSLR
jgi:hypothetical protein